MTILTSTAVIAGCLLALYFISFAVLFFVRVTLNASKWEGFWTYEDIKNLVSCDKKEQVQADDLFVCTSLFWRLKGHYAVKVAGENVFFASENKTVSRSEEAKTFHTREEAERFLEEIQGKTVEKTVDRINLLYWGCAGLLLVGAVLEGMWFCFTLAPVATVSILGVTGLTLCTRFLSGKLADNIKVTKENSDDIEVLKDEVKK